ncbi:hypothetical protein NIES4071_45340 [Calothrix sp. NIES-4071]|nr:hypothetical protein NIES4071_45340 [Calothrix sp. NIES-4071]BAZ58847.1 hypothetical protein NIES4105_45270 [Calothrix sp. NIES-4105]
MRKNFVTQVLQNGIRKALRNPKYRWAAVVAALFYFISPLDIVPDAIPILGLIDDGVIASFLVAEVSQIVMEQLKNRKKQGYAVDTTSVNNVIDVEAVTVN